MTPAPSPPDEAERLEVLRSLALLDTSPEPTFDALTCGAQAALGTEIALVSLVDQDRQWFKSKLGLEAQETHRDLAFCAHAILKPETFCVEDASQDPRFHDNPLVTGGPQIRAYAGAPMRVDGRNIGTVCAISRQPRGFDDGARQRLALFAAAASQQLETRLLLRKLNVRADGRLAPIPVDVQDFDLADLCSEVFGGYRRPAQRKGLSYAVASPPADTWVRSDPALVTQILSNLADNALKFTREGSIEISAERLDDEFWRFRIVDTGPGFAPEAAPRLFARTGESPSRPLGEPHGCGVGLALSRELARVLGGDLEASSAPGRGAEFQVTLPLPTGTAHGSARVFSNS